MVIKTIKSPEHIRALLKEFTTMVDFYLETEDRNENAEPTEDPDFEFQWLTNVWDEFVINHQLQEKH